MKPLRHPLRPAAAFPAATAALAAAGLIGTAQAQIQSAGSLLVEINASALPLGLLSSTPNLGTMAGVFEARGGAANTPTVAQVHGNGVRAIVFDGDDYLQHVVSVGG